MTNDPKNNSIMVTAALPYANGDLHLGNMVEYLHADFWVRFQRMRGRSCEYFCADDAHGTPIMVSARQKGLSPEVLIAEKKESHLRDFADFGVEFTHYSSTNTETNRELCEFVFERMKASGNLFSRSVDQLYSEVDNMFLPDRFVRGDCPLCAAKGQYGDSCDACGGTYDPKDLLNPRSVVSGDVPVLRKTEQLCFDLEPYRDDLRAWVGQHTSSEVANKMNEWLQNPLKPWLISRDEPYFGFQIPGRPGKYFYVWMDAPLGYLSTTKEWCEKEGEEFDDYWGRSSPTQYYCFIGKDIVYFHALFFPVMMLLSGHRPPDQLFVHGFLTINGRKMSKSKGTLLAARDYLECFDPVVLRYAFGCKVGSGIDDMDLSGAEVAERFNSDVVGKITNLASRSVKMLHKHFEGWLALAGGEGVLLSSVRALADKVAAAYEAREFPKGLVLVREMADLANRAFDKKKPWERVASEPEEVRLFLSEVVLSFRLIAICLKPIIPSYTSKVESLFDEGPYLWSDLSSGPRKKQLRPYENLAVRVDEAAMQSFFKAH